MPSIYYMNAPPHPFWDFVNGIEDHPFFAQHRQPSQPEQAQAEAEASTNTNEKTKGKQTETNPEDPPEIDPATVRPDHQGMPFRGRGRFASACDDNDNNKDKAKEGGEDCHRGKRGCHGRRRSGENGPWGRGGPPFHGPPPFMFGPNFPFGPGPHGPFGGRGGPGHEGPHEGGHGSHGGFRGRGGPPHRGGRWGGPHHGPHGHHGPHSRSPPRGPGGFDLSTFLNNLGNRLGVDLTSAAEGLGLGNGAARSAETDFEPRTDIFDTSAEYTIHLSLPGAKKSDVGVDWDGEHSTLRVAGVVHRPQVDEEMMTRLVVDGRKRETGVFEKLIRLGSPRNPASIEVSGITAKMVDGVLVVRVPKAEKTFEKKEVRIDQSPANSHGPEEDYMNEKDLLFDATEAEENQEMYDAEEPQHNEKRDYETKAEKEALRDDRSETLGHETPAPAAENLPKYQAQEPRESRVAKGNAQGEENMSDWEKDDEEEEEDEGEYVKINVD